MMLRFILSALFVGHHSLHALPNESIEYPPARGATPVLPPPEAASALPVGSSLLGRLTIADFRLNQHRYYETVSRPIEDELTVAFWILTQDRNKIINSLARLPGNDQRQFVISINRDGYVEYEEAGAAIVELAADGSTVVQIPHRVTFGVYDVNISDGTWHHIVVVKNRAIGRIYIDGIPKKEVRTLISVPIINFAFCIAADCRVPSDEESR